MRKIIFILITLFACSFIEIVAKNADVLMVNLRSGKKVAFAFSEKPKMTYSATEINVSSSEQSLSFAYDEVQKITFENAETSSIDDITDYPENRIPVFMQNGDELSIIGLEPDSHVMVYGMDGCLYGNVTTDGDGNASVALPTTAHLFIVKTSLVTFKFIKK